jgi:hypothetical protein
VNSFTQLGFTLNIDYAIGACIYGSGYTCWCAKRGIANVQHG